jgi:glycosyltransferase involved in cell wall biosynthesis
MSNPKVSVCIPSYNCATYLEEAIVSVLNQTFGDFELIIIDDRSSDSSWDIISGYAARYRRIRACRNDENLGMVANWNRCLQAAGGEYIRFLFSDDLLASPSCLEEMAAVLDTRPDTSLVASARYIIDDRSRVLKTASRFPGGMDAVGTRIIRRCLYEGRNLIGEPSVVMFRKAQAARGFHPDYRQLVDLEMWFHLLEQGRFYYLGDPLSSFREHPTQQTKVNLSSMVHIDESLMLLRDYLDKPYIRFSGLTRWYLSFSQKYRAWKFYKQGFINREAALEKIGGFGSARAFLTLLPVFKLCNPVFKLRGRIMRQLNKR